MNVEILIVTYRKDFHYLEWCLKSIGQFAKGFSDVTIVVPAFDVAPLLQLLIPFQDMACPVRITSGDEWPEKGMLWHMHQIMTADDICPEADFIVHIDSDCIFTGPVTPETYIKNGKPILRYEPFEKILKRHPGIAWREVTQRGLPFFIRNETMRCHPEVYHRGLYAETRRLVEKRTGKSCEDYIRSGQNAFPQEFCEFNTLGNVAMQYFRPLYECIEQTGDTVEPDNHLTQFWSHGPLDQPQQIWIRGVEQKVVPLEVIQKVLG